ncbi:hypothetical protein D3C72_129960 [compost metagenome]
MKFHSILSNMRARSAIGIGLSLLIHALILLFALDQAEVRVTESGESPTEPLQVSLITSAPTPKPAPQAEKQPAPEQKKAEKSRPAPRQQKTPSPQKNEVIRQADQGLPPPVAPKSTSKENLPPDMSDMLAAARERRRAAGIIEPDARPAEDDSAIARANIAEMVQRQARGRNETGGVFQITYKGVRNAEFVFRGWDLRRKTNSRQLIQVDAGPGGDIETAIVRRMIDLIRLYEREDFSWNSPRLGRVVILSARQRDSVELEEFLKRDFFDDRRR